MSGDRLELSRLREERDAALDREAGTSDAFDAMKADRDEYDAILGRRMAERDAAEARCARLQQALRGTRERTAPDGQPCWCPDWKVDDWRGYSIDDWRDPELQAALHHECCLAAREALAGPDTPAEEEA